MWNRPDKYCISENIIRRGSQKALDYCVSIGCFNLALHPYNNFAMVHSVYHLFER